jgi:RHS repeat-associated protein
MNSFSMRPRNRVLTSAIATLGFILIPVSSDSSCCGGGLPSSGGITKGIPDLTKNFDSKRLRLTITPGSENVQVVVRNQTGATLATIPVPAGTNIPIGQSFRLPPMGNLSVQMQPAPGGGGGGGGGTGGANTESTVESGSGDGGEDETCPPKCEPFATDTTGPVPPYDNPQVVTGESGACGEEPGEGEADNDAEDPNGAGSGGGGGGGGGAGAPPDKLYDSLVEGLKNQIGAARVSMSLGGGIPPLTFTATNIDAALNPVGETAPEAWSGMLFSPLQSADTPPQGNTIATRFGNVITGAGGRIRSMSLNSKVVVNVTESEDEMMVDFTDTRDRMIKEANGTEHLEDAEPVIINGRWAVAPHRPPYVRWIFSKVAIEVEGQPGVTEDWLHVRTTKVAGRDPSDKPRSWRFKSDGPTKTVMVDEVTGIQEEYIHEDDTVNQKFTRGEIVTTPDDIKTGWKAVAFGNAANVVQPLEEEGITTVHYGGAGDTAWKWASNGMFEKTTVAPALHAPQRTITVLRPWGNNASPITAIVANSHATVTTIQPLPGGTAKTVVEKINGIETKWTVDTKTAAPGGTGIYIFETRQRFPNGFNSMPLIDHTQRYKRDGLSLESGRPVYEQHADGTVVQYVYDGVYEFPAAPYDASMNVQRTITALDGIVRQEDILEDGAGRILEQTNSVVFASVAYPVSAVRHTYTRVDGGLKTTERKNLVTNDWDPVPVLAYERVFDASGHLTSIVEIDEAGVTTTHTDIDAHDRPLTTIRAGYTSGGVTYVPEQKTVRTFDDSGNQLTESVVIPDFGTPPGPDVAVKTQSWSYYNDGRLKSETLNGTVSTVYKYDSVGAGGESVQTYRQVGDNVATEALMSTTEVDWSGRISSVSGPEVITEIRTVEPLVSGRTRETVTKGSAGVTVVNKREFDGLDRTVAIDVPGTSGQQKFAFDGYGRPTEERMTTSLILTRSWSYNGNVTTATTYASPDPNRVSNRVHEIAQINGALWEITRDVDQEARTQLTGLADGVLAVRANGRTGDPSRFTIVTTSRGANGLLKQEVDRPGVTDHSETKSYAGLTFSTKKHSGDPGAQHKFDELDRVILTTDFSGHRATQFLYETTYGQLSQSITTPIPATVPATSSTTTNTYFGPETAQRGRLEISNLDGSQTRSFWTPRGELFAQRGATYPVKYEYDAAGRLSKMRTYRAEPVTDPNLWHPGDLTEWIYHPGTELLQQTKDAAGVGATYTYDAFGRTQVRTWVRTVSGQPLTTTYSYNTASELRNTNYSDTTPDVTTTRDAKGQIVSVVDGEGARTYSRNADGTIASETLPGIGNGSAVMQYGFDAVGRRHNYAVWDGTNWATWQSWGFDFNTGRYSGINTPDGWVSFSYDTEMGTFTGWTVPGGAGPISVTRSYDHLGRITSAQTSVNAVPQVLRTYGYDAQHRRSTLTDETAEKWTFSNGPRNQVFGGEKTYVDSNSVTRSVPGLRFTYSYDVIGNRSAVTRNSVGGGNFNNSLNQITSVTYHKDRWILGEAAAAPATLTVTAQGHASSPPSVQIERGLPPKAEKFSAKIVNNSFGSDQNLKVTVQETVGATLTEHVGHSFVPALPQQFTYDSDGNMTRDGRWNYTWDAENRLTGMETRSDLTVHGPDPLPFLRLTFKYDAFSRRVSKKVEQKNGSGVYEQKSFGRFVYDGWNLVAEWKAEPIDNQLVGTYHWGLDLTGTETGAGGVGGLVLSRNLQGSFAPAYDGNGNVAATYDVSNGTRAAEYEYGPFGEAVRGTGPQVGLNPFRWSTKYFDSETNLCYYGYRFYDPSLGRWLNRDPLGEEGGINLYAFVQNSPVGNWDKLGLQAALLRPSPVFETFFNTTRPAPPTVWFPKPNPGMIVPPVPGETGDPTPNPVPGPDAPPEPTRHASPPTTQEEWDQYKDEWQQYHDICDKPVPNFKDKCDAERWRIERMKRCVKAREAHNKKWHIPGTEDYKKHEVKIKEIEDAIKKREKKLKKKCPPKPCIDPRMV